MTAAAVEVLHRGQRVAAHRRSSHRLAHTTVPEHMPAAHRAHLEWSPARLIRWGAQHGPAGAQVIERILTTRKHSEQGYRACLGLLKLEKQHGPQRLEAAYVRALAHGSPAYQTFASILSAALKIFRSVRSPHGRQSTTICEVQSITSDPTQLHIEEMRMIVQQTLTQLLAMKLDGMAACSRNR